VATALRHQPRTKLLRLLVAGRRGTANERERAEKVRQYLAQRKASRNSGVGWSRPEATAASDRPHPCVAPSG
jgi:hypothetical protein